MTVTEARENVNCKCDEVAEHCLTRTMSPYIHVSILDPITTSTTYHPDCLIDHHGSRFKSHIGVRLLQKDIRDSQQKLVEPWRMSSIYKPGTFLLAVCNFRVWSQSRERNQEPDHVSEQSLCRQLYTEQNIVDFLNPIPQDTCTGRVP